jgi:hypothetical protein
MPQNMSLGSNRVERVRSLEKFPTPLSCAKFALRAPFQPFCTEVRAVTEQSETAQNMSLGSNGVDRVHSFKKFQHNFVAQTWALKAPVRSILHRSSCTNETVQNAPKHEFGVQQGGSGVFVAENSDVTLLLELGH